MGQKLKKTEMKLRQIEMTKLKDLQRSVRAKDREIRDLNERLQNLLSATNNTKMTELTNMGRRSQSISRNAVPKRYANFVEDQKSNHDVSEINDQKRREVV